MLDVLDGEVMLGYVLNVPVGIFFVIPENTQVIHGGFLSACFASSRQEDDNRLTTDSQMTMPRRREWRRLHEIHVARTTSTSSPLALPQHAAAPCVAADLLDGNLQRKPAPSESGAFSVAT